MRNKILLGAAIVLTILAASYVAFPSRAKAANDERCERVSEICSMEAMDDEVAAYWARRFTATCEKFVVLGFKEPAGDALVARALKHCFEVTAYINQRWNRGYRP